MRRLLRSFMWALSRPARFISLTAGTEYRAVHRVVRITGMMSSYVALRQGACYRTLCGRASHRLESMDNYGSNCRRPCRSLEKRSCRSWGWMLSFRGSSSNPVLRDFITLIQHRNLFVLTRYKHSKSHLIIKPPSKHHSKPRTSSVDPVRQVAPSPLSCL
jgi:hypothetical protein